VWQDKHGGGAAWATRRLTILSATGSSDSPSGPLVNSKGRAECSGRKVLGQPRRHDAVVANIPQPWGGRAFRDESVEVVTAMAVEDYNQDRKRWWIRLHEKERSSNEPNGHQGGDGMVASSEGVRGVDAFLGMRDCALLRRGTTLLTPAYHPRSPGEFASHFGLMGSSCF